MHEVYEMYKVNRLQSFLGFLLFPFAVKGLCSYLSDLAVDIVSNRPIALLSLSCQTLVTVMFLDEAKQLYLSVPLLSLFFSPPSPPLTFCLNMWV